MAEIVKQHEAGTQTENQEKPVPDHCEELSQHTNTSGEVSRMFIIFLQYEEIVRSGPCIHFHLTITWCHETGF